MTATSATDNPARGALYILAAAAAFSLMGVLVKLAGQGLPNEMLVFLRNAFALLFMLPWLLRIRLGALKTRALRLHLLRAATGLAAMYCLFIAIQQIPLAEAMLLNQTAALFIPFIALAWLGETFGVRIFIALLIGFTGVGFILKPGPALLTNPAALIGLASGLLAALSMVTIRRNARTEPPARIVFYFCVLGTIGSAVPLLWAWQTPTLLQWLIMLGAGGLATAGQLLVTKGYASAPPAQVGPFAYASVLFAALAGWLIWGEVPDGWSALGALLIISGGALAMRRRMLRLAVAKPAAMGNAPLPPGEAS